MSVVLMYCQFSLINVNITGIEDFSYVYTDYTPVTIRQSVLSMVQ